MKTIDKLLLVFIVCTVGLAAWFSALVFRCLALLNVPWNVPKLKPGMIIISNHPDLFDCMYEIFLLGAIFFPQIVRHPIKLAPVFTPDRKNFTAKWWWAWLRPFAIAIQRNGPDAERFHEAKLILGAVKDRSRTMLLFPEPGRTCTGKEFHYSETRRRVRIMSEAAGLAVKRTHVPFAVVWMEQEIPAPNFPGKPLFSFPNFRRGAIRVRLGKTVHLNGQLDTMNRHEVSALIERNLLETADATADRVA